MRPVGGWLLGRIGDRKGRKAALTLTVTLMSASAVLIADRPDLRRRRATAARSCCWSPGCCRACRSAASTRPAPPTSPRPPHPRKRGFASSFQYVSMTAGQLVGLGLQILLQRTMSEEALHSWGWRIPFIVGALGAAVVFYLRRNMLETEVYEEAERRRRGASAAP